MDLRLARLKSICLIAAVGCATGDRDHAEGVARPLAATPPSAAAQRLTAMMDRAGLTASGQPEITWRDNDLLARGATAEVVLPASPDAAFHVKSVRSPARIAVQLVDAQSATAEVVGGRVIYPGGYARGDVVHQLRDSGTEDFVVVRERGATSLDYDLVIEQGLAGLRLGPNVLELLDARGAPRLRVGTPYVVDDAGTRVAATLSVEGCAYDTSPAAPWGRPVTPPGASSCRVHVAWNDAGLRYPLMVDPAWVTTHNLIQDRDGHAATLLASGLVLLSGGVSWVPPMPYATTGCTSTYQYSAELFDPTTQTFAYTGNPVTEHQEHRSVTLTSGKAVVAGAKTAQNGFNTTEIYDPTAGTWSNSVTSPEGDRYHPALAPLPGGGAMIFGGRDYLNSVLKTTLIYTPGSNWVAGPPMTTARQDMDAVALDDGSVLIVAGTDEVGSPVPTSERYVPGVGWDAPVSLPGAAANSYRGTARLGNGKVLLVQPPILGYGSTIYDPATKAWSPIASSAPYNAKTAVLGNGQVLVLGTIYSGTTFPAVAQTYDAVAGWQSATVPIAPPRYPTDDTLTGLATGDALIAGGVFVGGCASTNNAQVYMLCPPWAVAPATLPAASLNTAYSQTISSTGAVGAVTYALSSGTLPSGITLASNGTLSGTPTVGGTFPITVKATDSTGCSTPKSYSLVVSCPTITVLPATATLPYGRGGTPYAQTFTSTGGIGAVTYSVTSGAVPPGTTLTSDGTLSGTPTAANNFGFTITATDPTTTCTGSQAYVLPIYCPSFTFSPSSPLPDGMAYTPYPTTMVVAGGALGATTYYVDNYGGELPPGMTLGSDGTLSGTPTQSGAFVFLVTASDSSMCMHTAMFQVTIDPNPEAGVPDAGSDAAAGGPDASSAGPDAGAPDGGGGGGGNDAGAVVEAGTDAATAGDGGPSGNDAGTGTGTDAAGGSDAGSGTGVDAASGTDAATGTDAAMNTSGADGAVTSPGADAAGAETGIIDLGDGSNAPTEGSVAPGSGSDSGATGNNGSDGSAPAADSGGSPAQQDGATESDATNGDASPEGALVHNGAGCSCRASRQTGSSWWPLAGVGLVFMAARRRASRHRSTHGRMR